MTFSSTGSTVPALVFDRSLKNLAVSYLRGRINRSGYWKPGGVLSLRQVPYPELPDEDWLIIRTIYSGICGSDIKQITLSGARDNPLQSLISFPHMMGHETCGVVERVGARVTNLQPGDRVAISPWSSRRLLQR